MGPRGILIRQTLEYYLTDPPSYDTGRARAHSDQFAAAEEYLRGLPRQDIEGLLNETARGQSRRRALAVGLFTASATLFAAALAAPLANHDPLLPGTVGLGLLIAGTRYACAPERIYEKLARRIAR